jgi:hypothetical protein
MEKKEQSGEGLRRLKTFNLKPLPGVDARKLHTSKSTPLQKSNRVHASPEEQSREWHQVALSSSVQVHAKNTPGSITNLFNGASQAPTAPKKQLCSNSNCSAKETAVQQQQWSASSNCSAKETSVQQQQANPINGKPENPKPGSKPEHCAAAGTFSQRNPENPKPGSKPENPKPGLCWPTDEQQQQFEQRTFLTEDVPPDKALISVKLLFKQSSYKSAHILQVPAMTDNTSESFANVHLIRYFVEKGWKLPKPEVLISVIGGDGNFDLSPEHKDRMMWGMMEGTRHLNPWSCACVRVRERERESARARARERARGTSSHGLVSLCLPFQVSMRMSVCVCLSPSLLPPSVPPSVPLLFQFLPVCVRARA